VTCSIQSNPVHNLPIKPFLYSDVRDGRVRRGSMPEGPSTEACVPGGLVMKCGALKVCEADGVAHLDINCDELETRTSLPTMAQRNGRAFASQGRYRTE
jgi:hypothetical protein